MRECLRLARKGRGRVSPNPLVGAVVVKGGKAVGRGYHRAFGEAHAEVNALRDASGYAPGATLYTSLEPCNYYGKTPPCTSLILESGIARVVVGALDPNPAMSGKSIDLLRRRGVSVTRGVLEEECRSLNRAYEKHTLTGMPYVILKFAQTLDAKIALTRTRREKITGPRVARAVHVLRSEVDAILAGAGTVAADNPQLTVRLAKGKNPRRVVLDGRFRSDARARVFDGSGAILLTSALYAERKRRKKKEFIGRGVTVCEVNSGRVDGSFRMRDALMTLGMFGITSVLVEGGAQVLSGMLNEGLADEILAFNAPKVFGKGLPAFGALTRPPVPLRIAGVRRFGNDVLIRSEIRKA